MGARHVRLRPRIQPRSRANIGLTDSNFLAKPALANWDALVARQLTS
jgi:hypothetical protein